MAKTPSKPPSKPASKNPTAKPPAKPASTPATKAGPKKQSSPGLSTLASDILSGRKKATQGDAERLAASVLGQDEKKGQK
ncbi:hypothetical protein [Rhizobium sp. BK251]|uniref:hypothetical protein n=1 Tax=Rhizobium sp. BK251 TaxID=2512125 RepID=UPI00104B2D9A|nr:hypothetical protein [Rhizobium sp. BK251]